MRYLIIFACLLAGGCAKLSIGGEMAAFEQWKDAHEGEIKSISGLKSVSYQLGIDGNSGNILIKGVSNEGALKIMAEIQKLDPPLDLAYEYEMRPTKP